jgi:diguanylate cyclase (GGDEF)-like protein/PAS domain S-box-containing protein
MNQQAFQQVSQKSPEAIPVEVNRIEGREWWLWGFAAAVTLALTLGIMSFTFPWVDRHADASYWFELREWVRGLTALVLLFDFYSVYQCLQLQRIRRQLAEQQALRHAEEKYRAIFEDAVVGIFQITPEGRPLSVNRALAEMHGYDSPEHLLAEVSNMARQLFVDPGRMDELRQMLDGNGVVRGAEIEVYRRDRTKKWVLMSLRAVRDINGKTVLDEGIVEDISDRKVAEERVQFLAYYDALTGLPNRTLLRDRLSKALASARRRKDKVALLFLDLDRFKDINDSLGHSAGDLLLKEVAERLKTWAREQDTVARAGGDEFLIVLTDVKDIPGAAIAAERLMDAMTAEFVVQGHPLMG